MVELVYGISFLYVLLLCTGVRTERVNACGPPRRQAAHTAIPAVSPRALGGDAPSGPTGTYDKWGDSELTALLYHAAAIKELLKVNANVLVICRGGNNRSRTLAGIAERLLDLETGETVAEGRTLPVDSELCKLVEVFDDRNAATRAGKITRYKAVGVTAEGRSKRKR